MPDAYVIRYPDGDFEYALGDWFESSVGEMFERRGGVWEVTKIVDSSTTTTICVESVKRRRTRRSPDTRRRPPVPQPE